MNRIVTLCTLSLLLACADERQDIQSTPMAKPTPDPEVQLEDVGPVSYIENDGYMLPNSHANIMRTFLMTQPDENGRVPGFNLDNEVTEEGDEASCREGDFVDAEGRTGIDNQLADLWAVVEPLVGEATEALIQGAVNEGRIAIVLELEDVDDLENDDDVTLHFYRGRIQPDIGNLGLIAPDQTVYFDKEFPHTIVENLSIVDGVIEAGPTVINLPIDILDAFFVVRMEQARIRIKINSDGSFEGVFGGVVDLVNIFDELLQTNASQEAQLVKPIFFNYADMNKGPNGCTHASTAFQFEGTTAFSVRYPSQDDETPADIEE